MRTLAVVGTGLIGTSVALAATRAGLTVYLADRDESAARTAAALGAGRAERPEAPVDLAVLAVPPGQIAPVLATAQARGLARGYTDVASVKARTEREVLATAPHPSHYVGGHPMTGREWSGPLAARPELFRDRTWVLTPTRVTSKQVFDRTLDLIALCGAVPRVMRARAHDDAVALTSHTPHLVASLMAARLAGIGAGTAHLAGQGLRDVTRIARGDPRLWTDILASNAAAVTAVLAELHRDLDGLLAALRELAGAGGARGTPAGDGALTELLGRGVAGLAGLDEARSARPADGPDGHAGGGRNATVPGAAPPGGTPYRSHLDIPLTGRPGELSRLLGTTAALGVTLEDTSVRCAPGRGNALVVRLTTEPPLARSLAARLRAEGWPAGDGPVTPAAPAAPRAPGDGARRDGAGRNGTVRDATVRDATVRDATVRDATVRGHTRRDVPVLPAAGGR
ncbi:prephenate dehydrogenase [Streptomyces sp. PLAI1-29]|uniref:Prephenate dehydrogenase n=1 Tax=Streptomyces zingiberis TaxID=2053010 RepID=A0ABX1C1G7_9ACTN|nr:prephenate dehydrogenase [Streptomyces zingiberis]